MVGPCIHLVVAGSGSHCLGDWRGVCKKSNIGSLGTPGDKYLIAVKTVRKETDKNGFKTRVQIPPGPPQAYCGVYSKDRSPWRFDVFASDFTICF